MKTCKYCGYGKVDLRFTGGSVLICGGPSDCQGKKEDMQRARRNANRRANDQARRDLGLVRNRDGSWE